MPTIADTLVSRRSAWTYLGLGLLVMVLILGFRPTEDLPRAAGSPANSQSAIVAAALATMPDAAVQPVLLVASRHGAVLDSVDLDRLTALSQTVGAAAGHRSGPVVLAQDRLAALAAVPITVGKDNAETASTIARLRTLIANTDTAGLTVQITGGPAFGADIAASFDGANLTLLLATIGIVAGLLIITYRSPVLFLVPLVVVGLADQVAAVVTARAGAAFGFSFDAGIVSVLVFGAGANYALLLISRYREQLRRQTNHRAALAAAWRASLGAIVASNVTVVAALGCLSLASMPGTRGLGLAGALGLLIALAAVLLVLPPALAVCGRRVFWPLIPQPGQAERTGIWRRIATAVVARPLPVLAGSVLLLGVLALGLVGVRVGLDQTERFRVPAESASGLSVLAAHFPAGQAQPLRVLAEADRAQTIRTDLAALPGVVRTDVSAPTTLHGRQVAVVTVIGTASAGTDAATALVDAVREVAGPTAPVGGQLAQDVDGHRAGEADLFLIAPLVLGVTLLVLLFLLRCLLAPVLLLAINVLSALATIGAGAWLSKHVLGFAALDASVPLVAFLFLVALGVDYTIFLVHRARDEAGALGTTGGMVAALSATGAVITSAGIVLAGVFAALGVLPLVTLAQVGLIVGLGVVLDTALVRTLLIPAVFAWLGDRIWWPRLARPVSREVTDAPDSADVGCAASSRR